MNPLHCISNLENVFSLNIAVDMTVNRVESTITSTTKTKERGNEVPFGGLTSTILALGKFLTLSEGKSVNITEAVNRIVKNMPQIMRKPINFKGF